MKNLFLALVFVLSLFSGGFFASVGFAQSDVTLKINPNPANTRDKIWLMVNDDNFTQNKSLYHFEIHEIGNYNPRLLPVSQTSEAFFTQAVSQEGEYIISLKKKENGQDVLLDTEKLEVRSTYGLNEAVRNNLSGINEVRPGSSQSSAENLVLTDQSSRSLPKFLVGINDDLKGDQTDITRILQRVINAITGVIGMLAVFILIWQGVNMVISFGGDDLTGAKRAVTWTILGLVTIMVSFIIVRTIINLVFSGDKIGPAPNQQEQINACPSEVQADFSSVNLLLSGINLDYVNAQNDAKIAAANAKILSELTTSFEPVSDRTNGTFSSLAAASQNASDALAEITRNLALADAELAKSDRKIGKMQSQCANANFSDSQLILQGSTMRTEIETSAQNVVSILDIKSLIDRTNDEFKTIMDGGFSYCVGGCVPSSITDFDADGNPNQTDPNRTNPRIK
jgi:hypothetical protein